MSLTQNVRESIIKDKIKGGVPTDNRDIRILNETMSGLDEQVTKIATIRTKHAEAQNLNAVREQIAEAIMNADKIKQESAKEEIVIEVNNDYIPLDIVPGETEIDAAPLDSAEFLTEELNKKDKDSL
jgi:hypothetical protein